MAVIDREDLMATIEDWMEEFKGKWPTAPRRNEEIALDLMRFIAETGNYGRAGVKGFQAAATTSNEEQYADKLLQLYKRCLATVQGR
jgi:hypothetical protein